jgi:hypothetical protein
MKRNKDLDKNKRFFLLTIIDLYRLIATGLLLIVGMN